MTITGTSALTNEVKPVYDGEYYIAGQSRLYFDQLCDSRFAPDGRRGSSYNFPIVESNQPSATALDELTDVTAQAMRANEISVTLQEFGGAIDVSKFVVATSYADVLKQAAQINGYQMAESLDLVVRAVAGQGSRVFYPTGVTARSSIDGQTNVNHRLTAATMERMANFARNMQMPMYDDNTVCAVIHPFCHYDLTQDDDIRTLASRQVQEILFNGETAYWSGIRLIVSGNAKGFWGEGASEGSDTTLNGSVAVGATSIVVSSATGIAVGDFLNIKDAAETGNTWSDTNELFYVTGVSGTTISGFSWVPGPGTNGGLRYAHANGATVSDKNSVYPITLMGPNSITKAASTFTGPYGETVVTGPFDKLGRFLTFGWYAILGYSRTRESWLFRLEVGSSQS